MKISSMGLAWISTANVERSQTFFKDVLGLDMTTYSKEWGWSEYAPADGKFNLGVCGCETIKDVPQNGFSCTKAGDNAVLTMNVDDIVAAQAELVAKNVTVLGDIIEVPGHVKMLMFLDPDGNRFQLVQMLSAK